MDEAIPGDRQAACQGRLVAIAAEGTDPAQLDLVFECDGCGKRSINRAAPDDHAPALWQLLGSA